MKMTVDELAVHLKKVANMEIVAFIVHDHETGVSGRVICSDCPKSLVSQMEALWGNAMDLKLPGMK